MGPADSGVFCPACPLTGLQLLAHMTDGDATVATLLDQVIGDCAVNL